MQNSKLLFLFIGIIFLSIPVFALDHSGIISSDEIWFLADSPHIVIGNVTINNGVTLTIEPGCEIKFDNAKSFYIYGTLSAPGTSGNEIIFTRNGVVQWFGLRFESGSIGSLEYCTVEYSTYSAGPGIIANAAASITLDHCILQYNDYGFHGTNVTPIVTNSTFQNNTTGFYGNNVTPTLTYNTFQDNSTAIYILNSASPVIGSGNTFAGNNSTGIHFNNCPSPSIASGTIIDSTTTSGIYYQNCSSLGTIDNLTMTANGGYGAFRFANSGDFILGSSNSFSNNNWPLSIDAGSFPGSGSTIPTSGSTNNDIQVTTGTGTKIGTWPYFTGLDYIVTGNASISATGDLTIEAGNTLKFDNAKSFYIHGTLSAPGTSGNEIIFTRNGSVEWYSLRFESGSIGSLEYSTVEYSTYSGGQGIIANAAASITLDHCILQYNDFGFHGTNCSPQFTNNQFINNNYYGIYLSGNCTPVFGTSLSEWNDIYGNGIYELYNGTSNISAGYVFWGTHIYCEMGNPIYDELDNISLGLVDMIPWTDETHSTAYYLSAPCTITITTVSDSVYIEWEAVAGSNSYNVYSSDDPYATEPWSFEEQVTETNWSESVSTIEKKFYHVKTVN